MRRIGELEAAVMHAVWEAPSPVTVRALLESVNNSSKKRPLAYTTILSVVGKLYTKGLLHRDATDRAHRYSPTMSKEQYTAGLMRQTLETSEDPRAALLHFVGELTAEERSAMLEHARRLKRA